MIQTAWRTALTHPAALLILATGLGLAAATGLLAAEFAARDVLVVAGFVVAFTGLVLSALFVRALYGDLTGRVVVAPQDRTR